LIIVLSKGGITPYNGNFKPPALAPLPFWSGGFSRLRGAKPAVRAKFRAFLRDQNGATAIEYALIAAGISIAIITAVKGIGTKLNTTFGSISTQLK
jgi:pilus assembly protein Flp/PilA